MNERNSTHRFSSRVESYIRYRPSYPPEMLRCLANEFGLSPTQKIADIGSGTGISAEIFLKNGNEVIGVEPNREMREAAERLLANYPKFRSINATAESTTLPDACVDCVIAAQAFHWFDPIATRREFARILRPAGRVALIWNERRDDSPFLADYEALLKEFGTDYTEVRHDSARVATSIRACFAENGFEERRFDNEQVVDFDGLRGRCESSSYVPAPGALRHAEMIAKLREVFDRHVRDGRVVIVYHARLFTGALPSSQSLTP